MGNINKIVERTFQVDPNIICVEDLELADYGGVTDDRRFDGGNSTYPT
jgi:hypothetical protein